MCPVTLKMNLYIFKLTLFLLELHQSEEKKVSKKLESNIFSDNFLFYLSPAVIANTIFMTINK